LVYTGLDGRVYRRGDNDRLGGVGFKLGRLVLHAMILDCENTTRYPY
jgi:hypothetical protein